MTPIMWQFISLLIMSVVRWGGTPHINGTISWESVWHSVVSLTDIWLFSGFQVDTFLKYFGPDENLMCYAYLSHILFRILWDNKLYSKPVFDTADLYFANGRSICGNTLIDLSQRQNRVAACQLMFSYSLLFFSFKLFSVQGD